MLKGAVFRKILACVLTVSVLVSSVVPVGSAAYGEDKDTGISELSAESRGFGDAEHESLHGRKDAMDYQTAKATTK
ncbi:MAG: hypothetical protein FWE32_00090 [Oscillospiraceae bacterium]|nr:hypothetical protein [Oscillospiraceae bacterium]